MKAEGTVGKRKRRREEQWRALLDKFEGSGQNAEDFCQREGVSQANLYRWRRRRGNEGTVVDGLCERPDQAVPTFVDLGLLKTESPSRGRLDLKLDLGDGMILHLVRG